MGLFFSILIFFALLMLALLLIPLAPRIDWHRHQRQQTNISLYQQQLAHIQDNQLEAELSQRLLLDQQLLNQLPLENNQTHPIAKRYLWIAATVLVLAPIGYYFSLERFNNAQQSLEAFAQQQSQLILNMEARDNSDYIGAIQQKLRQDPNDSALWLELGQAYMQAEQWQNALQAFANAEQLEGSQPAILGLAASAYYYLADEQITERVQMLIEAALQQDPDEASSLSLLAAEAYKQQDYAKALALWQQMLDSDKSNIDRAVLIQRIKSVELMLPE